MKYKLTSRKFWAAIAAFLMSLSTSIAGLQSNNEKIVIFGTICGVISAAIYMAAEAYTDGAFAIAKEEKKNDVLEPNIGFQVQGEALEEGEEG